MSTIAPENNNLKNSSVKYLRILMWPFLLISFFAPVLAMIVNGAPFDDPPSTLLVLCLISACPAIFTILLARVSYKRRNENTPWTAAVVFSAVLALASSLFLNYAYWYDVTSDDPSSTAALIYVWLPIHGLVIVVIGYIIPYASPLVVSKIHRRAP